MRSEFTEAASDRRFVVRDLLVCRVAVRNAARRRLAGVAQQCVSLAHAQENADAVQLYYAALELMFHSITASSARHDSRSTSVHGSTETATKMILLRLARLPP